MTDYADIVTATRESYRSDLYEQLAEQFRQTAGFNIHGGLSFW